MSPSPLPPPPPLFLFPLFPSVLEYDAACVAGSRASEGLLQTGKFCGDAQLAAWHAARASYWRGACASGNVGHTGTVAEDKLAVVRDWLAVRVQVWAVLVAGVSEEDAEKLELDGDQFAELSGDDLVEQLTAFGVSARGVEALVTGHRAGTWLATREVGATGSGALGLYVCGCTAVRTPYWDCTGLPRSHPSTHTEEQEHVVCSVDVPVRLGLRCTCP
jgi:hypothetical protein